MGKKHIFFWIIIVFVTVNLIFWFSKYSKQNRSIKEESFYFGGYLHPWNSSLKSFEKNSKRKGKKLSSFDGYVDSKTLTLKGLKKITKMKADKLFSIGRYVHPWSSGLQGLEFQFTETTRKLVRRLIEELEFGKKVDDVSVGSYTKHF